MSTQSKLYERDEWRDAILERDEHVCKVCGISEKDCKLDVHHIIERKLWPDGGYYLENGISLCDRPEGCHIKAETCLILPAQLWKLIEARPLLPAELSALLPQSDNLSQFEEYDKWGNFLDSSGIWRKGVLWEDEGCQKALKRSNLFWRYQD